MSDSTLKKPIYKKWWFYVILVLGVVIIYAIASGGADSGNNNISVGDDYETAVKTTKFVTTTQKHTSNKDVNSLIKIQRSVNSFDLGMTSSEFLKKIFENDIALFNPSKDTPDGRFYLWGGLEYNFKIEGLTFFFDSNDELYSILVYSDFANEYDIKLGDSFEKVIDIYGKSYTIIDGFYVFYDGTTYLEFALNSNETHKNFVDSWIITTRKREVTNG